MKSWGWMHSAFAVGTRSGGSMDLRQGGIKDGGNAFAHRVHGIPRGGIRGREHTGQ